ncbi:MAG: outer membrane protein transport protein, partial [Rikenellaceae bacterium]
NNPTWNNINTDVWGAVLGYKVGLADYDTSEGWYPGWISEDAGVGHYVTMESIGSVGEYDISMGANISNKFYIGATLGITSLNQRINYNYSEDYTSQGSSDYELNYAHYNQTAILNGTGVNFKLGIIYRPTTQFRVSFAVHTPTAYTIDREYQAAAASSVKVNTATPEEDINPDSSGNAYFEETSPLLADYDEYGWCFKTPTRILAGASYLIGNRAIVSIDYQRDWYNNMRMTSAPYGINTYDYENQANSYLKATNTLRIGGEFRVTPKISLRAGYGFASSTIQGDNIVNTPISPTVESVNYCSAGVGFAVSKSCSIDFAYMRHTTHYTDFQLFEAANAQVYSLDIVRNNFAMTTSIKW